MGASIAARDAGFKPRQLRHHQFRHPCPQRDTKREADSQKAQGKAELSFQRSQIDASSIAKEDRDEGELGENVQRVLGVTHMQQSERVGSHDQPSCDEHHGSGEHGAV